MSGELDWMCPECGKLITEEEADMFGGYCEECNLERNESEEE